MSTSALIGRSTLTVVVMSSVVPRATMALDTVALVTQFAGPGGGVGVDATGVGVAGFGVAVETGVFVAGTAVFVGDDGVAVGVGREVPLGRLIAPTE